MVADERDTLLALLLAGLREVEPNPIDQDVHGSKGTVDMKLWNAIRTKLSKDCFGKVLRRALNHQI